MEKQNGSRIPQEIYSFYSNSGGHSLILRGNAGSGKTTFALQTIEDLSVVERSFYYSSRVSDYSLLIQFPWLSNRLIPANGAGGEVQRQPKVIPDSREGLSALKGIDSSALDLTKGQFAVSIGRNLSELDRLYQGIEKNLPGKSLVVIDSIDGLAEKYGLSCVSLINAIQKDIVEGYGSNVMFITENSSIDLDYLGDGVVRLSSTEYYRRRVREIEIVKLRGCEIQQPKYLFTLKGGRIQSFGYRWEKEMPLPSRWNLIADCDHRVSSGLKDLDRLLMGGPMTGSINLLELGPGVPANISQAIEHSLVANFVSQGRGVLWVPLRKTSAETSRQRVTQTVPQTDFDRFVKIPEKTDQFSNASSRYVLPLEGSNAFSDFKWQNVEFSLSEAKKPYLALMGFDTLESIYSHNLMDQLMDFLASLKHHEGVFVAITSPSSASASRLSDLANIHLKLDRIGGTVVIYGDEPFTECNAVSFEDREHGGGVSLTPIV